MKYIINLAFERVSPTLWLWNIFDVFKCIHDNQMEILSVYCKLFLFHASAMLSLRTNFVLHSGPIISNLNPFPFNLPMFSQPFAISYFAFSFFELPLFRAVARKKIGCQCFEVVAVDQEMLFFLRNRRIFRHEKKKNILNKYHLIFVFTCLEHVYQDHLSPSLSVLCSSPIRVSPRVASSFGE